MAIESRLVFGDADSMPVSMSMTLTTRVPTHRVDARRDFELAMRERQKQIQEAEFQRLKQEREQKAILDKKHAREARRLRLPRYILPEKDGDDWVPGYGPTRWLWPTAAQHPRGWAGSNAGAGDIPLARGTGFADGSGLSSVLALPASTPEPIVLMVSPKAKRALHGSPAGSSLPSPTRTASSASPPPPAPALPPATAGEALPQ